MYKKGRSITQEEKIVSLAIQKQSPKAYKFLQKIFILPSEATFKKMLAKFVIGLGINSQILSSIKEEVSNWKEEKKYCSILFDEMALDTAITYLQKDFINDFVDLTERTNDFADHVLCFMVKDDTIHIGGYQLNIIFDPPHLIKGIRNNFLTKNIQLDGTIARWSDIVDVYKMDCLHAESRLLHKLTDEHVIPEKIKKMKVRNIVPRFLVTPWPVL